MITEASVILLVDDDASVREGLGRLLAAQLADEGPRLPRRPRDPGNGA
ncbi:hypothetical protein [Sorangium sp. So ce117]